MTVLEHHRQDILRIAARYGASHVRVVGGLAGVPPGPDDDVDLLVDMEADRSLFDLVELGQELRDLLGRRVEVLTVASLNPRLLASVLAGARDL